VTTNCQPVEAPSPDAAAICVMWAPPPLSVLSPFSLFLSLSLWSAVSCHWSLSLCWQPLSTTSLSISQCCCAPRTKYSFPRHPRNHCSLSHRPMTQDSIVQRWMWRTTRPSWREKMLQRNTPSLFRATLVSMFGLECTLVDLWTLNLGAALRAFLAFSAYSNGAKLVSTRVTSEGDLGAIHGIRLFSMSWVLLGHSFVFPLTYAGN
jgi:hypothetical protein